MLLSRKNKDFDPENKDFDPKKINISIVGFKVQDKEQMIRTFEGFGLRHVLNTLKLDEENLSLTASLEEAQKILRFRNKSLKPLNDTSIIDKSVPFFNFKHAAIANDNNAKARSVIVPVPEKAFIRIDPSVCSSSNEKIIKYGFGVGKEIFVFPAVFHGINGGNSIFAKNCTLFQLGKNFLPILIFLFHKTVKKLEVEQDDKYKFVFLQKQFDLTLDNSCMQKIFIVRREIGQCIGTILTKKSKKKSINELIDQILEVFKV